MIPSNRRYSAEVRERAVRLYFDHGEEFSSDWAAIGLIAKKLGITPEMLRKWVRRVEVGRGQLPGVTTDERERLLELERENRELRRFSSRPNSTVDRGSCVAHRFAMGSRGVPKNSFGNVIREKLLEPRAQPTELAIRVRLRDHWKYLFNNLASDLQICVDLRKESWVACQDAT